MKILFTDFSDMMGKIKRFTGPKRSVKDTRWRFPYAENKTPIKSNCESANLHNQLFDGGKLTMRTIELLKQLHRSIVQVGRDIIPQKAGFPNGLGTLHN